MKTEEVMDLVRFHIGNASFSRMDELIDAFDEFCRTTPYNFLRKTDQQRLIFEASKAEYLIDMSDMRRLERLWIYGVDDTEQRWHPLDEVTPLLFEVKVKEAKEADGSDDLSRPYFYKIEGSLVTVSPIPDQTYNGRADYIEFIEGLERDKEVPIPPAYHRALAKLAAGFILEKDKDEKKIILGTKYIGRARKAIQDLAADSHPNRISSGDRPPVKWIR